MMYKELAPNDLRWVDGREDDMSVSETARAKVLRLLDDRPEGPVLAMILGLIDMPKPAAPSVPCPECGKPIRCGRVTDGAMVSHRRSHKAVAA